MTTAIPKPIVSWLLTFALAAFAADSSALGQTRSVRGVVTDQTGEPLMGAVVKVKNTVTLHIRSYITQADGEYRFQGLHPDVDYQLMAKYRGITGKTKTLHWYDSCREARIELKLRIREDARHESGGEAQGLRQRNAKDTK